MCLSLVKAQVTEWSLATADKLTTGSPHTSASSRFVAQELFTMSIGQARTQWAGVCVCEFNTPSLPSLGGTSTPSVPTSPPDQQADAQVTPTSKGRTDPGRGQEPG